MKNGELCTIVLKKSEFWFVEIKSIYLWKINLGRVIKNDYYVISRSDKICFVTIGWMWEFHVETYMVLIFLRDGYFLPT